MALDHEKVLRLFQHDKLPVATIAYRLGVRPPAVCKVLVKHGIKQGSGHGRVV